MIDLYAEIHPFIAFLLLIVLFIAMALFFRWLFNEDSLQDRPADEEGSGHHEENQGDT
jgi:hypothetical protein